MMFLFNIPCIVWVQAFSCQKVLVKLNTQFNSSSYDLEDEASYEYKTLKKKKKN